jgi:FkbM family methyltransferase
MLVAETWRSAKARLRSNDLARRVRRNRFVELGYQTLGRAHVLNLHQIDVEIIIQPGDVIVDCGANVGQVTSQFARSGALVYAFEPNPVCFQTLQERFKFVRNVKIQNVGIMDRPCVLTLSVMRQHAGLSWETSVAGTFHAPPSGSSDELDTYDVDCIDLSAWLLARQGRVRLLKMDIEGSEIDVINRLIDTGAINRIDLLVCETHDNANASLVAPTQAMRARLEREGLSSRVRLDWP